MSLPAAAALAQDVGVSISLGEPGFYGQINIGSAPPPQLVSPRPITVIPVTGQLEPLYLRVPKVQRDQWPQYCARYHACNRPVLFVRDRWYREVYVPHYRAHRAEYRPHEERREERHEERREEERRDERRPDEHRMEERRMEERRGDDRR